VDIDSLAEAPFARSRQESGALVAEVIDIDRFGSVRIAVPAEEVLDHGFAGKQLEVLFGHARIELPFGRTFADVPLGEPVALIDSSGWLTVAIHRGSAAERFGVEPGIAARVRIIA
jgi:hypothetical protein